MYEELAKRLRELASIPEHCENVDNCDKCSKEDICLSFTNERIIEVTTQAADAIEELGAKVNSLQIFADNISKLPDCNTCLKQNRCEFMPRWGEYCRINCPEWLGTPEPPKEET